MRTVFFILHDKKIAKLTFGKPEPKVSYIDLVFLYKKRVIIANLKQDLNTLLRHNVQL
jgi:hypothetical protein